MDRKQGKVVDALTRYKHIWKDTKTLKALLCDVVPEEKMIVHLMVAAYEENICGELQKASNPEMIAHKYVKIMEKQFGVTEDNANWVVETWALVLGISIQPNVRTSNDSKRAINEEDSKLDFSEFAKYLNESRQDPLGLSAASSVSEKKVDSYPYEKKKTQVKDDYEKVCEALKDAGGRTKAPIFLSQDKDWNIFDAFRQEFMMFLVMIAVSDSNASQRESGFIEKTCLVQMNRQTIDYAAKDQDFFGSGTFNKTVPVTLKAIVERKIIDPSEVFQLYLFAGYFMAECDGKMVAKEESAIRAYCKMLYEYIEVNCDKTVSIKCQEFLTEFDENLCH